MNAEPTACPACQTPMESVADPDLTFDRCPSCGGVFFDHGELNAFATGMSGDIEYCSLEPNAEYEDRFPERTCPRCAGKRMKKEDLLIHSDLIFDHCTSCHGWFLDRGEVEAMNQKLAEIRRATGGDPEYRDRHGEHLVTVTETSAFVSTGTGPFGISSVVPTTWRRVEVYFTKPLGVGLKVTYETWATRLWHLFGVHDVETGDEAFDEVFRVEATDARGAANALGGAACKALLAFHESPLAQLGKHRSFEVRDDRLLFALSDWGDPDSAPSTDEMESLIDTLVGVAGAIVGTEP